MQLHIIDWILVAGYCIATFWIGLYYSKRASQNINEFFVAGNNLSWWIAGTSMVATTFAVDTPLVVSGLVRKGGIYEVWYMWSLAMGGVLTVFFFARLWRRAGIITDAEFVELRYSGKAAAALRAFQAVFNGIIVNCIVIGWVMLAMVKITGVLFDLDWLTAKAIAATGIELDWGKIITVAACSIFVLIYTISSGFWGVVMTDFLQFIVAMAGAISLAAVVLWQMGGPAGMVEQVAASPGFSPKVMAFVPTLQSAGKLAFITFVVQLSVQWLGAGPGAGYIVQRMVATKNEKHAVLSALWFNIANNAIRPWPWIIVGLASLVYFPINVESDAEMAYPRMMMTLLPTGLKGLMLASMLAAFMSTIDTQLNWGASYLVSDIYRRFMKKNASDKHYVNVSRLAMCLLLALGGIAAWQSQTISAVWKYLMTLMSGGAMVALLRWYWWRVNPWSEISALVASLIFANANIFCRLLAVTGILPTSAMSRIEWFYSEELYAVRLFFIIVLCTIVWVVVTYLTAPVSDAHLERFYRKVRPGGWWNHIAKRCSDVEADSVAREWIGWVVGVISIYASVFGLGYLCLARPFMGIGVLIIAAITGWMTVVYASHGAFANWTDEGARKNESEGS